jgi:sodium/potassium-transporting ATPase subunit alpha
MPCTYLSFEALSSYRTLSIHVDDKPISTNKKVADPSDAIRLIDAHSIDTDQVFHRYSTHPKLGLEGAAVERKSKEGKNIISPPPSQYVSFTSWNLTQF